MSAKGFFNRTQVFRYLSLVVVFSVGLGLRLVFLTSPPLDFLSGRQLRSAIIARGMFCELVRCADEPLREAAIGMWKAEDIYEPQIFERLVSTSYVLLGQEYLWISRLYAGLFWLIGAIALFDLAQRMTSFDGALVATACYTALSNIVIPGRSFQPEPFTTLWAILAVYSLYRWAEGNRWKWAILGGIAGGIAILIKVVAVFPVVLVFSWLALMKRGLKGIFRDKQVWAAAAFMVIIPSIYYLLIIGGRSSGFFQFWTLSFLDRIIQPGFYVHWLVFLHGLFSLVTIFAGWFGALTLAPSGRAVFFGWWVGYLLYGLFLPVQVTTHNYYNLILSPAISLGLAPLGGMVFGMLAERLSNRFAIERPREAGKPGWQRYIQPRLPFFGVLFVLSLSLLAIAYPSWITYSLLRSKNENLQGEIAPWVEMGRDIPEDGAIIALTHDYGNRLRYYGWRSLSTWPYTWDLELVDSDQPFSEQFKSLTHGKKYFVVTEFSELEAQPNLKNQLYEHYPIVQDGNGYIVFDLSQKKSISP
jgi:4-amino-4-deoxy-L-arabinose transferase-like glycosyltransferase